MIRSRPNAINGLFEITVFGGDGVPGAKYEHGPYHSRRFFVSQQKSGLGA
jgi:hypothetical protein